MSSPIALVQGAPLRATEPEPMRAQARASTLVAPFRTRLASAEASTLLRDALKDVTGEEPSASCVAILTAQWAHETGRGASMYNYNFAGIKGSGPTGASVAQRTSEGWGRTASTRVDRFRAYESAEAGARDYVKLLRDRFPRALDAAREGDPAGCVRALKDRGYFTGDETAYTRSVVSLAREFAPGVDLEADLSALPRLAPTPAREPAAWHALPPSPAPFVDVLAISDEVSRAALSALSAPAKKADEDSW